MPRREVADIDHPGNVVAIVGGVLAAMGGVVYAASYSLAGHPDPARQTVGLVYLIPGALMVGVGLYEWFSSTGAASPEAGPPDEVRGQIPFATPIPLAVAATPG